MRVRPLSDIRQGGAARSFWIISGLTVLLFALLAWLFPYTGDDWAWGSSIGTKRLSIFFDNYNGRYLGNLLILLVSRSVALRVVLMAAAYYISCWLCHAYSSHRKNVGLVLAVVLFFMMPRAMFTQAVVWSSGFANYVPSAILSVAYILIIRNITGQETPQYGKYLWIATAVMGFVGAPFMENIALFNICLGLAVIGYTALKFKKLCAAHVGFFLGAVAGAVWMFTNRAYVTISNGGDDYRTAPTGLGGMLGTMQRNIQTVASNVLISNCAICLVVSVLLLVLTMRFVKTNQKGRWLAAGAMMINGGCAILALLCNIPEMLTLIQTFVGALYPELRIAILLGYGLSLVVVVLICVPKGGRFRMLLPVYCIPVSVAPLLVVTPIGPRCFYISYLLTMVFAVELFSFLIRDVRTVSYKRLFGGLGATAVLLGCLYVSVFVPVHRYDKKRNEFAKRQSDNGDSQIVVCTLPNDSFLWVSSPENEPWGTRYKLFYGIREDAQLKVVDQAAFDAYYESYGKER